MMDFLGGSDGKESACNAGYLGSVPGLRTSPGEGNGNPLQYPCLENPMDRGAWQATVYGIAKSQTQMSNFHLLTLDDASFPWGGNPKSIWFRPPRPSSFKGMKTASPHENAEGPVGLGREEQETSSENTLIDSFSRCR